MRLVNQAAGVRRTAVAILVAMPVRIIAPADATSSYRACDDDVILDINIRSGTVRIRFNFIEGRGRCLTQHYIVDLCQRWDRQSREGRRIYSGSCSFLSKVMQRFEKLRVLLRSSVKVTGEERQKFEREERI